MRWICELVFCLFVVSLRLVNFLYYDSLTQHTEIHIEIPLRLVTPSADIRSAVYSYFHISYIVYTMSA